MWSRITLRRNAGESSSAHAVIGDQAMRGRFGTLTSGMIGKVGQERSPVSTRSMCSDVAGAGWSFISTPVSRIPSGIQPKFEIGPVDDPLEREADAVADRIMRMPEPQDITYQGTDDRVRRKCKECAEGEQASQKLVGKESGKGSSSTTTPDKVNKVLSQPSRPLDPDTRSFFELRFGHDFSQVRLHSGELASRSADLVAARAYTVGTNIIFQQEEYSQGGTESRRLLAHELTHVIQQGTGGSRTPVIQRQPNMGGSANPGPGSVQETFEASPFSRQKCYNCQIPGGVGICCYAEDAPFVPECFELGKKIIDECKDSKSTCLQEAQCAQCQCLGRVAGQQYCQCGGIV